MPTVNASLPATAHEHRDRIHLHLERLPQLAAMLGQQGSQDFAAAFETECRFVTGQLVPHMEATETALYDRLESVMGTRHSMAPMREEHERLRRLISSLCVYRAQSLAGALGPVDEIGLRRVLYRLYTMLKVHLAEEELYLRVLDGALTDEEKDHLAERLAQASAEPL